MARRNSPSPKEKVAREKASKLLASAQTRAEDVRRRLTGVLFLLATVVLVVGSWTLGNVFSTISSGPAHSEQSAIATAKSCEQLGPLSKHGFGYWWECTADLRSSSGGPTHQRKFDKSELTPVDIGKPVHVAAFGGSSDIYTATYQRDTTRPLEFMWYVMLVVPILPGLYFVMRTLTGLSPLWWDLDMDKESYAKYYEKYVREGRLSPEAVRGLAPEPVPPPPGAPPPPGGSQQPPAERAGQQPPPIPPSPQAAQQSPPTPYEPGPGQPPAAGYGDPSQRQ